MVSIMVHRLATPAPDHIARAAAFESTDWLIGAELPDDRRTVVVTGCDPRRRLIGTAAQGDFVAGAAGHGFNPDPRDRALRGRPQRHVGRLKQRLPLAGVDV